MTDLRRILADLWKRLFHPPPPDTTEAREESWESRHREARESTLDSARRMGFDSKLPPMP